MRASLIFLDLVNKRITPLPLQQTSSRYLAFANLISILRDVYQLEEK